MYSVHCTVLHEIMTKSKARAKIYFSQKGLCDFFDFFKLKGLSHEILKTF
jgi:hypothetical protein